MDYFDGAPEASAILDPRKLVFGSAFNQSLEQLTLPESLRSLVFGSFNRDLKGVQLPQGLQELSFADSFNQSLHDVVLPESLVMLDLGYNFDQSLEGVRFQKLSTLNLGEAFNQSMTLGRIVKAHLGRMSIRVCELNLGHSLEV